MLPVRAPGERGSGDDVRGVQTAVGGDQCKVARDGQLDVQGVDQSQLMTPRPGADEKVTDIVAIGAATSNWSLDSTSAASSACSA